MNKYDTDVFQKLILEDQSEEINGKVYILKGEPGLGQSDLLHAFRAYVQNLHHDKAVLDIRVSANSFSLYSIWSSLKQYISISFELNDFFQPVSSSGLNYEEYILSKLLRLGREKKLCFFCEDIARCDTPLYEFIKKIASNIFPIVPSFIMCCLNQNQEFNFDGSNENNTYDFLASLGNRTKYIFFPLWTNDKLKSFLANYLCKRYYFSDNIINLITQASFGNPTQLLGIIEYLKSEGIIYEIDGYYHCNYFNEEFLQNKAEQYVKNKYCALSPSMQYVLRGSSVIGYEFSKALLTNPLKMLLVDSQLRRIEYQTHIIHAKDEDLFEFHDNTSHLSIRNIVPPEEYLKWNILLAGYFLTKAQNSQSGTDSIDRIIYLSKSAYYYSAAEQKEKTALIYLRLLPLLISIMDYENALSVISNLHHLYDTDHSLISSSDMHHLYLLEGDCYYSLFQYNSAVLSYKHYSETNFITKFEFLGAQCQYAFALYYAGETEVPYSLLQNVFHELNGENNKKSAEIKVRALSFISSIEETIWNGKHIEHYNQALALAKEYKLYNEYYQLLRKALIAYKGKTGIRLMSTARDYYKQTNNIKEYAMCLHNISVELLYHGDLEQAKINLEESIMIFQSFGSDGAHCPMNALGDYWTIKGNFRKALSCYKKAYNQQCDLFSQIGILINLSTAHRCLRQYRKATEYLKSVERLLSVKQANNYAILKQHYYLSMALTDTECGRYEHAYKTFLQYFDRESNRDSHRMTIASRALQELCNITKFSLPEEYENYIYKDSTTIERLAPHQLVLVRLSFAE